MTRKRLSLLVAGGLLALGGGLWLTRQSHVSPAVVPSTTPVLGAAAERPTYEVRGDRIVAHVRPDQRGQATPLTAEQLARLLKVPGAVSVAGEEPPARSTLTPAEQAAARTLAEARDYVRGDLEAAKSDFVQGRRELRDREASRMSRRYGDNRDEVRGMRRAYHEKRSEILKEAPRKLAEARAAAQAPQENR